MRVFAALKGESNWGSARKLGVFLGLWNSLMKELWLLSIRSCWIRIFSIDWMNEVGFFEIKKPPFIKQPRFYFGISVVL